MNPTKEKVLVSACLIGENCRYDGKNQSVPEVLALTEFYDLIPICPEVSGGMKIPRFPSEIQGEKVINKEGKDVTDFYEAGAYWAASICQIYHIRLAILKEDSPSCGAHEIHDGSFTDKKIPGKGITARRLEKIGVKVMDEKEAKELLKTLKSGGNKPC
jgi:uncharacterized protein YbbK (DUF523 family)